MKIILNATYKLRNKDTKFECDITIDNIGLCYFGRSAQPTMIELRKGMLIYRLDQVEIYHGKTNSEFGSLSFTYEYPKQFPGRAQSLGGNNVAVFLDDADTNESLWYDENGIWQISESSYDQEFPLIKK